MYNYIGRPCLLIVLKTKAGTRAPAPSGLLLHPFHTLGQGRMKLLHPSPQSTRFGHRFPTSEVCNTENAIQSAANLRTSHQQTTVLYPGKDVHEVTNGHDRPSNTMSKHCAWVLERKLVPYQRTESFQQMCPAGSWFTSHQLHQQRSCSSSECHATSAQSAVH